jgi:hypothetical protein
LERRGRGGGEGGKGEREWGMSQTRGDKGPGHMTRPELKDKFVRSLQFKLFN